MVHAMKYVARRYKRRSRVLILLGLAWILYGVSILVDPPAFTPDRFLSVIDLVPSVWVGAAWIACGGVAGVVGLMRREYGADHLGFVFLILMPIIRGIGYLVAWITYLVADVGTSRGWITAIVWLSIGAVIGIVAGWPEPNYRAVKKLSELREKAEGN